MKYTLLAIILAAAAVNACSTREPVNDQYRNNAGDQDQTPWEYRAIDRAD